MKKQTAPYVRAVMETALEPWLKSLRHVERRLREGNLVAAVDDTAMPQAAKKERLAAAMGDAPMSVVNLILTMAGSGHLHLLGSLIHELEGQVESAGRGLLGTVRSAVPLTAGERQRLELGLAQRFGEELVLKYVVDESLIGGLVVRVGDMVMDGSVAARLAALRDQLS
jgi:F-type H+-transporting ATPase subunit delta